MYLVNFLEIIEIVAIVDVSCGTTKNCHENLSKKKLFKSDETAQWKLDQLGRSAISWWVGVGGRDLYG